MKVTHPVPAAAEPPIRRPYFLLLLLLSACSAPGPFHEMANDRPGYRATAEPDIPGPPVGGTDLSAAHEAMAAAEAALEALGNDTPSDTGEN